MKDFFAKTALIVNCEHPRRRKLICWARHHDIEYAERAPV